MHEGVKYGCNTCNQQVCKYACNQCDFQATRPDKLEEHAKAKRIHFTQGNLTQHLQSYHEGVKYSCSQCDYQATRQDKTYSIKA